MRCKQAGFRAFALIVLLAWVFQVAQAQAGITINGVADEEIVYQPGDDAEVRIVALIPRALKIKKPVAQYEVVDRSGNVITGGKEPIHMTTILGGYAEVRFTVPKAAWVGVQVTAVIDGEREFPVDALPVGFSIALPEEREETMHLFGNSLGVTTHFGQGETLDHLAVIKELGAHWVRDHEPWNQVEKTPGEYVLPDRLVERLRFYKEHNLNVLFGLWYGNDRAYPQDPFDPEAYGRYAAAMARVLKSYGVNFALELWNEPHNFALKKKFGGEWNAAPPSPWVDRYVAMVDEAVAAIREVDPTIPVLTNEDVIVAHYWFLEKGLPSELTGFAIHPYVHGNIVPERVHYGPNTGWTHPFDVVAADRSFRSMVQNLQDAGQAKLGKLPQIWATEWAYPLNWENVDEALAAAYLPRMFITAAAAGVTATFWHTIQDLNDGPYGLVDNDQARRQTFTAYKTMSLQLGDYRLSKQVLGADNPVSGVQAYLFTGSNDAKVAAWSIDGVAAVKIRGAEVDSVQVIDHLGRPVEYQKSAGVALVPVSTAPVYIGGLKPGVIVEIGD